MTSKFSIDNRELLQRISSGEAVVGIDFGNLIVRELAAFRLAAMDSEPVAEVVSIYGDPEAFGEREIRPLVGIQQMPYGTKLYRHAQPVLEIESEPVFTLEVARADYKGQKLGNHFGFITLDAARELKEGNYQLYTAQPAPLVPDGYVMVPKEPTAQMYDAGDRQMTTKQVWDAMLAAGPQEVPDGK